MCYDVAKVDWQACDDNSDDDSDNNDDDDENDDEDWRLSLYFLIISFYHV